MASTEVPREQAIMAALEYLTGLDTGDAKANAYIRMTRARLTLLINRLIRTTTP